MIRRKLYIEVLTNYIVNITTNDLNITTYFQSKMFVQINRLDILFHKMHYSIMAKDYVHVCADGKKKSYQINDTLEYAMLKMNPKCPSCTKSLLG